MYPWCIHGVSWFTHRTRNAGVAHMQLCKCKNVQMCKCVNVHMSTCTALEQLNYHLQEQWWWRFTLPLPLSLPLSLPFSCMEQLLNGTQRKVAMNLPFGLQVAPRPCPKMDRAGQGCSNNLPLHFRSSPHNSEKEEYWVPRSKKAPKAALRSWSTEHWALSVSMASYCKRQVTYLASHICLFIAFNK